MGRPRPMCRSLTVADTAAAAALQPAIDTDGLRRLASGIPVASNASRTVVVRYYAKCSDSNSSLPARPDTCSGSVPSRSNSSCH